MRPRLIVLAKAPVPGLSKTRLCPPCTPVQAAAVAEAALADTLSAVMRVGGIRPLLVLDGTAGAWMPRGLGVVPQRGGGLDERLAAAFEDCGGPALLIGMDTPQVTPEVLGGCVDALLAPGVDAVLGPAIDGGWWAAGLRRPRPSAFLGVPMSTGRTCDAQRRRLAALGLEVGELPALQDVDKWENALSVFGGIAASGAPGPSLRGGCYSPRTPLGDSAESRFAAAVDAVARALVAG
ncbi:MAG TPA: TIGR04282 family arsenosugar biosynthesis glycosyltransferase [Actinomycetota bacterium]|nr:TIGR04282 family arsenosugar biosynthesis glycosyltransferase [Actinomycetota bacterium]